MATAEPSLDGQQQWVVAAVDQYEVRLVRYATRLLRDEDAARDVVQFAFLRLCDRSRDVPRERIGQWLYTVCRNKALDMLRVRRRTERLSETDDAESLAPDPADMAEQRDLYGRLCGAIASLPLVQREAIGLWAEGLSYREIAEITGQTEGSLRVLVCRGLNRLRQHPVARQLLEPAAETVPLRAPSPKVV
jgi:RNA polymerase sigma-70 factor (ECF subfamily)